MSTKNLYNLYTTVKYKMYILNYKIKFSIHSRTHILGRYINDDTYNNYDGSKCHGKSLVLFFHCLGYCFIDYMSNGYHNISELFCCLIYG